MTAGIKFGLSEAKFDRKKHSNFFSLLPFSRGEGLNAMDNFNYEHAKFEHRINLCSEPDIFIFAFGNKLVNNQITAADGMKLECDIAMRKNALIIPIPSTGGTAKIIYDELLQDPKKCCYGYFEQRHISNQPGKRELELQIKVSEYLNHLKELEGKLSSNNIQSYISKIINIINLYS